MSTQPFTLCWGIVASGHISSVFVKDIILDPKTRNVHDIIHKVVAVGSRDVDKAKAFVSQFIAHEQDVKAYGSYEEVYADPNVDAIYVGEIPFMFLFRSGISR